MLRLLDAVKLDGHLIDLSKNLVAGMKERVPLRALDVDLERDALPAVAIPGHLIGEGVEDQPVLLSRRVADALGMKDDVARGTARRPRVEAIVLMKRNASLRRDVAAPLIEAVDAVRVARLHGLEQVGAHEVSTVVRFAESLELAVRQASPAATRRTVADAAASRPRPR